MATFTVNGTFSAIVYDVEDADAAKDRLAEALGLEDAGEQPLGEDILVTSLDRMTVSEGES